MKFMDREVIKIGSRVLCDENGINDAMIIHIAAEVAELQKAGKKVILVSSGAARTGKSNVALRDEFPVEVMTGIQKKDVRDQVRAAVGQIHLMTKYQSEFARNGLLCAQVLVTRTDFEEREKYIKLKMVIENMLRNGVIPIFNENDVLSHAGDELDFRDNDHLACIISAMLTVDRLVILTGTRGVYERPPHEAGAVLLSEIKNPLQTMEDIKIRKADISKGGMVSKLLAADLMSSLGIPMYIMGGTHEEIMGEHPLTSLILGKKKVGTFFPPTSKKPKKIKAWITTAQGKGTVVASTYLAERLEKKEFTSILLRGIEQVEGIFEEGDVVIIVNEDGGTLGKGQVRYSSDDLRREVEASKAQVGQREEGGEKIVVHYDYFVFNN